MFLIVLLTCIGISLSSKCSNPPPARPFSLQGYLGKWYQIAKYQTAGGAYFQKNCTCTEMDVSDLTSGTYAYQTCIKNGKVSGVNATLLPTGIDGVFIQKIGVSKVGYWVIQLDQDTAIQYDCSESLGVVNYCVHIMSRKTTLSETKLKQLSDYALSLGLNQFNLPITITDQSTCRKKKNIISQ